MNVTVVNGGHSGACLTRMQALEHIAFLGLNSMLGRQMLYHVAGVCTLTRNDSIALITYGRIFIAFGEMEPDLRSLPTHHDAALLFDGCRRTQGRRKIFA